MQSATKIVCLLVLVSVIGLVGTGWNISQWLRAHYAVQKLQRAILHAAATTQPRAISSVQNTKTGSDEKIIESFLDQAKLAGLDFQLIAAEKLDEAVLMNAALQGSFMQLIDFFIRIQACPYAINHMELVVDDRQLKIALDFTLLGLCAELRNKKMDYLKNAMDPFLPDLATGKTVLFSIQQMRLAGYVQEGKRWRAIILLPNGVAADVQLGDSLGLEKATVIRISTNEVVAQRQGQQWKISNDKK